MQVKFVEYKHLAKLHKPEADETPVLERLLNHADAFLERHLRDPDFRRDRQPRKWSDSTIYILPIGVRSAKDSTLAKSILAYPELVPQEYRRNLLRPVLFLLSENTIHDWDAHRVVKGRQFYLQTAASYGIGRVVPYSELDDFLLHVLDALLSESANVEGAKDPCDVELFTSPQGGRVSSLGPHVARVYRTFCGGLNSLFRLQHDQKYRERAYANFNMESFADDSPGAASDPQGQEDFLRLLSVAYHVGRYRRAQFHAARLLTRFDRKIGSTRLLKELRADLIEEFRRQALIPSAANEATRPSADRVSATEQRESESDPMTTYGRLRVYYLLRDCARSLAAAATIWTAGRDETTKRRILLIDDNYRADVNWRLTVLKEALWENQVEIDIARPGIWVEFSTWFETNWGNQVRSWEPDPKQLKVERMPDFPLSHQASLSPVPDSELLLGSYDVILLDAEVEGRDRGPELVFWLDSLCRHEGRNRDPLKLLKPRLLVLTDARPTENLQQCLNLGVETYVSKDRIFDLPFAIMQVSESFGVRKDLGSAQDFTSVQNLPLRTLDVLRNTSRGLISGNPLHYADRRWIKKLPKADLHYHIGTSITLESISAMALNTMGYLLDGSDLAASDPRPFLKETVSSICELVHRMVRAAIDPKQGERERTQAAPPPWAWPEPDAWAEFMWRCHMGAGAKGEAAPPNVFDQVIKSLHQNHYKPIESFEVASVLVAAISYWEERISCDGAAPPTDSCVWRSRWRWVRWLDNHKDPVVCKGLWSALLPALEEWTGIYTRDKVRDTFVSNGRPGPPQPEDARPWEEVGKAILGRCENAWKELEHQYERLAKEHGPVSRPASNRQSGRLMQDLVAAPEGAGAPRSLPHYLRGAGLLGADHLQFPENILLAALDITKQNVEDNVWYSELRCSTNGYCNAGLSPFSATDILCRSFDLAAYHWAEVFNDRWVLVNVLLGAKRHKADEIPEVVSLLMGYLRRPMAEAEALQFPRAPGWWKPSRVIGFDLSGNETQKELSIDQLQKMMNQLLAECAQITIHAGEAASAENIWDAVYRLGARRIGHGLRLREHSRLRDHAMRLGICMELCPTSNALTNDFARYTHRGQANGAKVGEKYDPANRWHYPLLTYVDANMQVCLNTDNRFLHRGCHALTDEYLEAARMVGGLSRLQILRLTRAGFATAFLDHKQKDELMKQVDEAVYRLLSEHDEEVHGPNGS